jgi:hypothetical protein
MRIIIEIEGAEVTAATIQANGTTVARARIPSASGARAALAPPPEVLEAAAALGFEDAGPAPAEIFALDRSSIRFGITDEEARAALDDAEEAGEAPGAQDG